MTQDELWLAKWQEAIDLMETNYRKPSKFSKCSLLRLAF